MSNAMMTGLITSTTTNTPPLPTDIPTTMCEWAVGPNSTDIINVWMACVRPYENTTVDSLCVSPATMPMTSAAHGDPVLAKWVSMTLVVGIIVQLARWQ